MATLNTMFKLNTGAEIPAVGFGTWQDKDAQEDAVTEALKAGYRHIDTARMYVACIVVDWLSETDLSPDMAPKPPLARPSRRAAFPATSSSLQPNCGTTGGFPFLIKEQDRLAKSHHLSLAVCCGRSPSRAPDPCTTKLKELC